MGEGTSITELPTERLKLQEAEADTAWRSHRDFTGGHPIPTLAFLTSNGSNFLTANGLNLLTWSHGGGHAAASPIPLVFLTSNGGNFLEANGNNFLTWSH